LKYILPFILIIFFTACSKNEKPKNTNDINKTVISDKNTTKKSLKQVVILKDLNITIQNGKLVYPDKRVILLFENNNSYSNAQELVLKKLDLKFYTANSEVLKKYFNIEIYPTIVVLDKNKTVKYENFTPYEILKAEGF